MLDGNSVPQLQSLPRSGPRWQRLFDADNYNVGNREQDPSSISSRLARVAAWLSFTFILSFVFFARRRRTVCMFSLIALLAAGITLGCGSSSSPGAKEGNLHAITITASSRQFGPMIVHIAKLQVETAAN